MKATEVQSQLFACSVYPSATPGFKDKIPSFRPLPPAHAIAYEPAFQSISAWLEKK